MNNLIRQGLLALPFLTVSMPVFGGDGLDRYNVVWTTPSRNSAGSMPVGGGEIGCNVWVENGDLLCYMQRSGCFDENNQYLKLGRLRIRLEPNPFQEGTSFRQELRLRDGYVNISGQKAELSAQVQVWVDVFSPAIHLRFRPLSQSRHLSLMRTGGSRTFHCRTTNCAHASPVWAGTVIPGKSRGFVTRLTFPATALISTIATVMIALSSTTRFDNRVCPR